MTEDQVKEIVQRWKEGYVIYINDDPVLDSFVKDIRITDDGEWVYDSDNYEGELLSNVLKSQVRVFIEIDFISQEKIIRKR